jgi:hypothetical protein
MNKVRVNNSPSQEDSKNTDSDLLGLFLVLLSSILLGIWAVKGTIALRNILLVCGTLTSLYYIAQVWRYEKLKEQCTIWKVLPFFLIGSVFIWVLMHYFLFSIDPVKQFNELRSTWLRAFLAAIVGLGTGLALRNHLSRLNLLWLGIFVAFLVLYYQYIPRAIAQNKLLVPDYDHYLFHLKINTVLMGMILIAGISGTFLDHLRAINYFWRNLKIWYLLHYLIGTSLALWAFVYIVDARNGMGLATILYGFWFLCALVFLIRSQMSCLNLKTLPTILIMGIGFSLIFNFTFLQATINKGWHNLFDDIKLAVQIDRYPHWQNTVQLGYPTRDDGLVVTISTYERVAWATAGSRAIIAYPQGVGLLAYPFERNPNSPPKMVASPNSPGIATHSGWVELGLAFGIPIMSLIFSALLLTFVEAARYAYPASMTALGFVVLIVSLYTVGEVAILHGIEILFYILVLIPALLFTKQRQIGDTN